MLLAIWLVAAAAQTHHLPQRLSSQLRKQMAFQEMLRREMVANMPPPQAYIRAQDREFARSGKFDRLCIAKETVEHGIHMISSLPTDRCYKMDPPKRMKGVWVDNFEGSMFFAGATKPPHRHRLATVVQWSHARLEADRKKQVWLDIETKLPFPSKGYGIGKAFFVEFIGRKTAYSGYYGHMGMSGNEIIVDKMLSIKELK